MSLTELLRVGFGAIRGHALRSALSVLGIAIGIAAVILLTSIGEGTRRYILAQFTQFGTNILQINPGKTETTGIPGVLGGTTRKLTIDDAEALTRLPNVKKVVPVVIGQARVEGGGRGRSVYIYGVTSDMPDLWKFDIHHGSFLPPGDPRRGRSVAVLGPALKRELFEEDNALGEFVRIEETRFRVIGLMEPKGRILGFDVDDSVYIPVASAMKIFNMDELMEIDVLFTNERQSDEVVRAITETLTRRHGGDEDFTVITQTAMIDVFDNVVGFITLAVGAIAGISLVVGAIGILTMMWISVRERTAEIGLVRAMGASSAQVFQIFLTEASILGLAGGIIGVGAGLGMCLALTLVVPGLPVYTSPDYVIAALAVSLTTGLLSGVAPASHASALDPIEALRAE